MLKLVIGGSASGKSEYAEEFIISLAGDENIDYIATMKAYDEESVKRIDAHRIRRFGKSFVTMEKPVRVAEIAGQEHSRFGILECVSNLLANEMFSDEGYSSEEDHCMDEKCSGNEGDRGKGSSGSAEKINIAEKVAEDIIRLAEDYEALVVVSNDIFQDSIIYDESVEEYIRGLGMINRSLAGRAETVTELVCGIPVEVKG